MSDQTVLTSLAAAQGQVTLPLTSDRRISNGPNYLPAAQALMYGVVQDMIQDNHKSLFFSRFSSSTVLARNSGNDLVAFINRDVHSRFNDASEGIDAFGNAIAGNAWGDSRDYNLIRNLMPIIDDDSGDVNLVGTTIEEVRTSLQLYGQQIKFSKTQVEQSNIVDFYNEQVAHLIRSAIETHENCINVQIMNETESYRFCGGETQLVNVNPNAAQGGTTAQTIPYQKTVVVTVPSAKEGDKQVTATILWNAAYGSSIPEIQAKKLAAQIQADGGDPTPTSNVPAFSSAPTVSNGIFALAPIGNVHNAQISADFTTITFNCDPLQQDISGGAGTFLITGSTTTGVQVAMKPSLLNMSFLEQLRIDLDLLRCPYEQTFSKGSRDFDTRVISASRILCVPPEAVGFFRTMESANGYGGFIEVGRYAGQVEGGILEGEMGILYPNWRIVQVPWMQILRGAGQVVPNNTNDGFRSSINKVDGKLHYDVFPLIYFGPEAFSVAEFGSDTANMELMQIMPGTGASVGLNGSPYARQGRIAVSWRQGLLMLKREQLSIICVGLPEL